MNDFAKIAGALVLAGVVVAGTLYYRAKHAGALGGVQPGVNGGPGQQLNAYNKDNPRPASGNYVPPGGQTAADVSAWLDVAAKGSNILGGLFQSGNESSAVGARMTTNDETPPLGQFGNALDPNGAAGRLRLLSYDS